MVVRLRAQAVDGRVLAPAANDRFLPILLKNTVLLAQKVAS